MVTIINAIKVGEQSQRDEKISSSLDHSHIFTLILMPRLIAWLQMKHNSSDMWVVQMNDKQTNYSLILPSQKTEDVIISGQLVCKCKAGIKDNTLKVHQKQIAQNEELYLFFKQVLR